jgi:acyl-[acyl-carrier-protein]-phospholipid O-acyltransferase/long-chain-fatty-acid--[acyl-carrier-protein] ligase
VKVDVLPVLGTGKLDLRGVKRIAIEKLASRES